MTTDRNSEGAGRVTWTMWNDLLDYVPFPDNPEFKTIPLGWHLANTPGMPDVNMHEVGLETKRIAIEALTAALASAPASIPAAEVQALVERMDATVASDCSPKEVSEEVTYWRDELAKLIPRKPE